MNSNLGHDRLAQREERPREEVLREYWNFSEGVVRCVQNGPLCTKWSVVYKVVRCVQSRQPAQYILYCNQSHYRIYCHGWPALCTTDHLHLTFKSSLASSGWQRTGLLVYVWRLLGLVRGYCHMRVSTIQTVQDGIFLNLCNPLATKAIFLGQFCSHSQGMRRMLIRFPLCSVFKAKINEETCVWMFLCFFFNFAWLIYH
jgi:hypothetical protein